MCRPKFCSDITFAALAGTQSAGRKTSESVRRQRICANSPIEVDSDKMHMGDAAKDDSMVSTYAADIYRCGYVPVNEGGGACMVINHLMEQPFVSGVCRGVEIVFPDV